MTQLDPSVMRTEVTWRGKEKPGTIVVKISERRLYLVEAGGQAIRYGVGVGRSPGVNFRGEAVIGRKEKWPHWTPTENMMEAIPMYRKYAGGMDGGPGNPLGPRALYLYRNGHDTNFRLHGTTEPETIGTAVSSGCIRLFNQDIIDLYNRVPVGAHVKVVS
jgi:lipoprotein-anchoring transpeptidase ErfK/SrfK